MKRSLPLLLGVSAVCVALDQASKHWANAHLAYAEPIHVVGNLVRLTYTRNSGIAFGLFAGRAFPFYIFSIIAAIAVFVLFFRQERLAWPRQLSLALILGGAIGNLIDRMTTGEVVDFILLAWGRHEFPIFNVADMCVTFGVALFALVWTHDPKDTQPASQSLAANALAPGDGISTPTWEPAADDANAGDDRDATGSGTAGGSLARDGADRPQP
ncbi:MAG: signal peptidase II [Candidatus Eisenbacteria bacterium]